MDNILIIGFGYVGSALAKLFKSNNLYINDISQIKIQEAKLLGYKIYDPKIIYNYTIICVPTPLKNKILDTSIVENIRKDYFKQSKQIIIKSTMPINYNFKNCWYWPEFLTEKNAEYDIFNPDRIIIGSNNLIIDKQKIEIFINIILASILNKPQVYYMTASEAAAVKLYSNSYLAMRIAFFNELDTFACKKGFDSEKIKQGICSDNRIGNYYNNFSNGFGGHCLPKDTADLSNESNSILFKAVLKSNKKRKQFKHSN